MRKPVIGNRKAVPAPHKSCAHQTVNAGACGKALLDILSAAVSPDNLDAFLRRIIAALCRRDALGSRAGVAVTLRLEKAASPFTVAVNFTKEEQRRLSAISCSGSKWPKNILSTVIRGGAAKGFLLARLPAPASRACAGQLLEIAAETISGRLAQESREGRFTLERDIADALTHLEELYLAFPAISLAEISRTVLDEARRLTGSRVGFAGYIDPATGWLQVPTLTDEVWKNCRVKKCEVVFKEFTGLWGWVLKNKKPMLTNSAASDPRAGGVPHGHIKIEKFTAAPAVAGKKLIGILALANPHGNYPPTALDAVTKLARVYALLLLHKLTEQQQQTERLKHKSIVDSSSNMIYNRTAEQLAESELKYRKIAALLKAQQEASPDAILVVDKDGRIRSFNRHFTKMWGLHPKIMAVGSDEAALRAVRGKLADPRAFLKRVKYLYRHPNEESRDTIFLKDGRVLERYSTAVLGSGGEYYGRTWHFQDTTESRRLGNILKENEETLSKIFDTTTDAIFLKDTDGRYLKVNKACADLFLLKAEKMLGKNDIDLFSHEIAVESLKDDAEVMRQGRTLFFNKERVFHSGKSYMSVAKTPLRGPGGKITGVLGVIRDITGIKKMETELAIARATDALSKVARPIAHGFNNALAAINGYATLIDDDLPASSPIKMEISRIIEAVRRATALTSKLQDFARNPKIGNPGEP